MVASSVTAVIGLALLLASTSGRPSAWLLGALVLAYVTSLGFGAANTTAAALENHAGRAGLASALLGAGQFATAALTAATVGALADGTARPMALVMVACAVLALTCVTFGRRTSVIPAEARTA
jgi:DHA1 family bicyclomycin/chloramphenicol resistance-like MFS transporter